MRFVLLAVLAAAPALAADPGPSSQPAPKMVMPTPGPETKILDAFVPKIAFKGVKRPGGVDVQDVTTLTCAKTAGGMYVTCTAVGAPPAPGMAPFEGVYVFGYDYIAKRYAGFSGSMQSIGVPLFGKLDGKKLVLENAVDIVTPSGTMKTRHTFDFTNPKAIKHVVERTDPKTGAWLVFSEGVSQP